MQEIDRIFDREDKALHSTWTTDEGGIVSLHVPGMGEVKMTLAKAEEISVELARNAEYGRRAAKGYSRPAPVKPRREARKREGGKEWSPGDKCSASIFGNVTNGEIMSISHQGTVAMVKFDGYTQERTMFVRNLQEPINRE